MFKKGLMIGSSLALLIMTGCSTVSLTEVTKQYYEGSAAKAYVMAKKGANVPKKGEKEESASGDELLWRIQGGIIGFDLNQKEAGDMLELAEKNINQNELEGVISGFFQNVGALLVNDTVMPYKGFLYEGAMVNYYKALFYLSEKKYADARVEFNRASDRQRRIKEYYEKEIAKAKEAQNKVANDKENKGDKKSQDEAANKITNDPIYSNLSEFANLNGYINPMIDYVAGVYFMLDGDLGKAADFLKESYGVSNSEIIKQDLDMAQNGGYKEKQTWVIIEDGKSPFKIEKKFSMPVILPGSVVSVDLALPAMKKGVAFANSYEVTNVAGAQSLKAYQISTLNPLVFNEFGKQLPFIITRGVLSTSIKTLTQYFAQQAAKKAGGIASLAVGIGGAIYSKATAQADKRISTVMPNSFYVVRIKNAEGKFDVKAGQKVIATIDMSENCENNGQICVGNNNIVYIRNAKKNIFKQVLFSK